MAVSVMEWRVGLKAEMPEEPTRDWIAYWCRDTRETFISINGAWVPWPGTIP
jgi:hypothetical protein